MSSARAVVVGGGPAGMLAAGRAAQLGAEVLLLEKGPRLGRKLRISGKGRGNITNAAELDEFIEAFAPNGKFLYSAFSRFFRDDLIALLHELGVQTKTERGGRVFPASDRASDVADALESWIASLGVTVRPNTAVRSVAVEDGRVTGVEVYGGKMSAGAVVLATGGASYPKTGSTGDGYVIAARLGHQIARPEPGLSSLVAEQDWVKDLQGLSLRNVKAALLAHPGVAGRPRRIAEEFGEMLFTHSGISGPIVLTLSRKARLHLREDSVEVSVGLKPALTQEQLHARLISDFRQTRKLKNYLPELMPRLLASAFPMLAEVDAEKPLNVITGEERTRLVERLNDLRITVSGMGPLDEAIVTAGGVVIREIEPRTMMSKLVAGFFFAGEVIDVDAETGGFNLQAAFSTGFVAGEAACRFVRGELS